MFGYVFTLKKIPSSSAFGMGLCILYTQKIKLKKSNISHLGIVEIYATNTGTIYIEMLLKLMFSFLPHLSQLKPHLIC